MSHSAARRKQVGIGLFGQSGVGTEKLPDGLGKVV